MITYSCSYHNSGNCTDFNQCFDTNYHIDSKMDRIALNFDNYNLKFVSSGTNISFVINFAVILKLAILVLVLLFSVSFP